ncbi:unnamed protein product [Gongylonema pulchrum]|uniref:Secreted protein n=1 Tax=Gongylonema pulchrum TaxID=637853 RepID=A0A183DR25_9BILA|nr:unnamed protein product [Gongylonema pulchrum]
MKGFEPLYSSQLLLFLWLRILDSSQDRREQLQQQLIADTQTSSHTAALQSAQGSGVCRKLIDDGGIFPDCEPQLDHRQTVRDVVTGRSSRNLLGLTKELIH